MNPTSSQSAHRDITLFPVKRLAYPYERSTVFYIPPSPVANGRTPRQKTNGETQEILGDLHIVDYRYSRFALDVRTGLFSMIRYGDLVALSFFAELQQGLA